MTNRRPKASAPTTPPPPKPKRGHTFSAGKLQTAAKLLVAFVSDPLCVELWRELEECRVQAMAAGVETEFETCWQYELARHKELPGAAPRPKQVLQMVLKIAPVD